MRNSTITTTIIIIITIIILNNSYFISLAFLYTLLSYSGYFEVTINITAQAKVQLKFPTNIFCSFQHCMRSFHLIHSHKIEPLIDTLKLSCNWLCALRTCEILEKNILCWITVFTKWYCSLDVSCEYFRAVVGTAVLFTGLNCHPLWLLFEIWRLLSCVTNMRIYIHTYIHKYVYAVLDFMKVCHL